MTPLQTALLKTIAYHAVFNYPLTTHELRKYLIGHEEKDLQTIREAAETLDNIKQIQGRWYALNTPPFSPEITQQSWSLINYAVEDLKWYSDSIPFIKMIAISGSSAALNAKVDDDIDLFVITAKQTEWITRTLLLTLIQLMGKRVNTKKQNNHKKFCINLIIDSSPGQMTLKNQDIYTAMEIAHLKVLYEKEDAFAHFLAQNNWIEQHLPNYYSTVKQHTIHQGTSTNRIKKELNTFLERIHTRRYQTLHRKNLTLNNNWEHDYRGNTLEKYRNNVKKLGVV